jgi:hypothetical protein
MLVLDMLYFHHDKQRNKYHPLVGIALI